MDTVDVADDEMYVPMYEEHRVLRERITSLEGHCELLENRISDLESDGEEQSLVERAEAELDDVVGTFEPSPPYGNRVRISYEGQGRFYENELDQIRESPNWRLRVINPEHIEIEEVE